MVSYCLLLATIYFLEIRLWKSRITESLVEWVGRYRQKRRECALSSKSRFCGRRGSTTAKNAFIGKFN